VANKTNNYKFPKPEADDFYDISEYNKAMDILEDSLTEMDQKKLDKNGDASEAVTEFQQEILRENIESGETLSSMFGKVKKWFAEMKDVAFSGHAKDVTTDAAHRFVSDTEKDNWNGMVLSNEGDVSNTVINSLESISQDFPEPEKGETLNGFLGKVKKFIQDFNKFKPQIVTVNNLINDSNYNEKGCALDARYGKVIFEMYTKVNNDLKKYLPLTGGTLTGTIVLNNDLIEKNGHRVHTAIGVSGTGGYVGICRFTIMSGYINQAIKIKILQRGLDGGEISIRFANDIGHDPNLASFYVKGDLTAVRLVKVSSGVWDLYVEKSEAYDCIDIVDIQIGYHMSGFVIEWTNKLVASNPGGTLARVLQ
jgi:hypothetical protein